MNSYKKRSLRNSGTTISVVFLTVVICFAFVLSASARFQQAEAVKFFSVATEASATILGATTNQHLSGAGLGGTFGVNLANLRAHAIATGDVNGDGIPDVITGAPEATFTVTPAGGSPQTRTGAGLVYIVLGKTALTGTIDTNAGQADITILGGKSGDKAGFAVAIGDVNGDGIDDISIGAPGADFPGATTPPPAARIDTGAVFVIFGSAALSMPHAIDLATTNAASVALFGVASGDQFGASLAVGNVGGLTAQTPADQAVKDILVGAPGNTGPVGNVRLGAGAAFVQFGGPQLNPVGGATTVFDLAATPANVVIFGKAGAALGTSVAIGDINGGGAADVILGAPLADRPANGLVPAATGTGAVFAVFGGTNLNGVGTSKSFDINATQQNVSVYGAGNKLVPGADDADHFGFSVAAGDVTGDGTPDLLIGAPDADGPNEDRPSAGEAYVILGGTDFNPIVGTERRIDLFAVNPTLTVFGGQSGDHFGSTVVSGNYNTLDNTDRISDLIVGAPGANGRTGIVSIVFGGANLLVLPTRDLSILQDNLRFFGQSAGSNDLSNKTLRIKQTLTSTDQAVTPFLQQLLVGINGNAPVVNDDTQANFATGTLTQVAAASSVIPGETTAVGDLELAANPSLAVDGTTTGVMTVPTSASLKPGMGNWTVEFWIKRLGAGTGDFPPVIGSRPLVSPTEKGWGIALEAGTFKVSAHFSDGIASGINLNTVKSTTGVSVNGVWQHWAVVFNRTQNLVQFYKNGALDLAQSVTFPVFAVDQTDDVLIGKDPAGTRLLQANLDDIRVWNVARTAQQIQDSFKSELAGTETGLAANWNFNLGNASDLTANANNGALSAGATIANPTDRRFLTGNRVSNFTFPAATTATTSSISWVQTLAAGTTLKIETSLDAGATFQTAINGGGIPSLVVGDELGWAIATADVNNNQGGDLIVGAPFANVASGTGARTQAGIVYIVPSTFSLPPINLPPTVTVTAPNGAETLQVGQTFDITWTASDPNGDATIQKFEVRLSTDGGTNFNFTIAPNLATAVRKFTWTVPVGFNTTLGRVRVIVTDDQSVTAQDDSNANFTITDVGVTAALTSPNGGQNFKFGQQTTITWTVPIAVAAQVKGFDIFLSLDSGVTFPIQIAPSIDPTQPALGVGIRSFVWTVPSTCASKARIAVVTTSLVNVRSSDSSDADFMITDAGPTIDTANMFLLGDFQLFLLTTAPAVGSEVLFTDTTVVEVSTDSTGLTFFTFSKPGKIKKAGGKYLSKGTINGLDLGTYFPNGAVRLIRLTKPPCGITLIRVTRSGEMLVPSAAEETASQPMVQRVWQ